MGLCAVWQHIKNPSLLVPCSVRVLAHMLELDMPHGLCAEKYVLLSQDEINLYNCLHTHAILTHTQTHMHTNLGENLYHSGCYNPEALAT